MARGAVLTGRAVTGQSRGGPPLGNLGRTTSASGTHARIASRCASGDQSSVTSSATSPGDDAAALSQAASTPSSAPGPAGTHSTQRTRRRSPGLGAAGRVRGSPPPARHNCAGARRGGEGSGARGAPPPARVRAGALLVEPTAYDVLLAKLEPATTASSTYRHSPRELLALAAWKAGNAAETRKWVETMSNDNETPSSIRTRAEALQALLPPAAKS